MQARATSTPKIQIVALQVRRGVWVRRRRRRRRRRRSVVQSRCSTTTASFGTSDGFLLTSWGFSRRQHCRKVRGSSGPIRGGLNLQYKKKKKTAVKGGEKSNILQTSSVHFSLEYALLPITTLTEEWGECRHLAKSTCHQFPCCYELRIKGGERGAKLSRAKKICQKNNIQVANFAAKTTLRDQASTDIA